MARNALCLLIIMLVCTHFIPSSSIPLSRTKHLLHQSKEPLASKNMNQMAIMASAEVMGNEFIEGRMDIQVNDYPPTGPNPYHTPKPPHT